MRKIARFALGLYDLLLSVVAIRTGVLMLTPGNSVFASFPDSWETFGLMDSWFIPGFVSIIIFGIGNMLAGLCCFIKHCKKPWFISGIMGGLLMMAVVSQVIISKEWYLVSFECIITAILQLGICYNVHINHNL